MIQMTVAGNVGNDPEMKRVGEKNTPVLKFSVASNGYKQDEAPTWVRVALFGPRAETLAPMIHKGDRIVVAGSGKLRTWKGDNGERTDLELDASEVHLVERKGESKGAEQQQQRQGYSNANGGGGGQQQPARRARF